MKVIELLIYLSMMTCAFVGIIILIGTNLVQWQVAIVLMGIGAAGCIMFAMREAMEELQQSKAL